jgi:hypothetical protein
MKLLLTLIATAFVSAGSYAQDTLPNKHIRRNTIYVEAFGQGIYNSISYDRLYCTNHKIKTSVNAGVTLVPLKDYFVIATPVAYNFLFGKKSHHLELGLGVTAMYAKIKYPQVRLIFDDPSTPNSFIEYYVNKFIYFSPKVGYRFQQTNGGFFMVINFVPAIYFPTKNNNNLKLVQPWKFEAKEKLAHYKTPSIGLSLGYTF